MSNQEFQRQVRLKYPYSHLYNFSQFDYKNYRTKSIVLDESNNEFLIDPRSIYRLKEPLNIRQSLNKNKYFEYLARQIHGDKYNYSKVNFLNSDSDVIIICNKHGEFKQRPANHLTNEAGCLECSKLKASIKRKLGKKEILKRANKIHNCKYDYVIAEDATVHDNLILICPKHGEQKPQKISNHIHNNYGCYKCAKENSTKYAQTHSNINKDLDVYLYHMKLIDKNDFVFYKIGLSINPKKRLKSFCNLKSKEILETKKGKLKDLYPLEQKYHSILKDFNVLYEPPELIGNGSTECYSW
jgi:hypothetical protein